MMGSYNVFIDERVTLRTTRTTAVDCGELPAVLALLLRTDLHRKYASPKAPAETDASEGALSATPPLQTRRSLKRAWEPVMTAAASPLIEVFEVHGSVRRCERPAFIEQLRRSGESTAAVEGAEDTQRQVLMLPKRTFCALSGQPNDGDYYVFLMSHPLKGLKTETNIGYSKDPIHSLYLHNHGLVYDKVTAVAAPFWRLDNVLGPFSGKALAMKCAEQWVAKTRGTPSKQRRAKELAQFYAVNLYSAERRLTQSFISYLYAINAPYAYIQMYQALTNK